ncbi:hypothetical protein ACET3Z_013396 [Daucus carota]
METRSSPLLKEANYHHLNLDNFPSLRDDGGGGIVEPDNGPSQKIGDLSVKVSEENRIAAQEAKGKVVEAISEGEVKSSVLGKREDMIFCYKKRHPDFLDVHPGKNRNRSISPPRRSLRKNPSMSRSVSGSPPCVIRGSMSFSKSPIRSGSSPARSVTRSAASPFSCCNYFFVLFIVQRPPIPCWKIGVV